MSSKKTKSIDWRAVTFSVFLALALAVIFDFSPTFRVSNTVHNEFDTNFTYFDLAAFLLGSVGLIVAAMGVVFAVLAIWGYDQIKKASISAAVEKASETALNHVKASISDENGELFKLAKKEVQEIATMHLRGTEFSSEVLEEGEAEQEHDE